MLALAVGKTLARKLEFGATNTRIDQPVVARILGSKHNAALERVDESAAQFALVHLSRS